MALRPHLSRPNAMPPCGGAPTSRASNKKPNLARAASGLIPMSWNIFCCTSLLCILRLPPAADMQELRLLRCRVMLLLLISSRRLDIALATLRFCQYCTSNFVAVVDQVVRERSRLHGTDFALEVVLRRRSKGVVHGLDQNILILALRNQA